ncbi:beta-phosphoglucomutase [Kineothrix sedimenti]|uniref:Beta-phosphoglucomutase n=1 Tax=Kineothrix sedimenti TaxID=3123317 RepID=A0ABZ3ET82_9FIRM
MNKKAVIFDLDGVICSTDKYHYIAWKAMADSIQVYFDENINHRLRGVSRMESLEIILERAKREFTEEEKIQLTEKKNQIYQKMLNQMSESDLSGEVWNTLKRLKESGILLAIGSSSKNTKLILERLGLKDFFDIVIDGNDISNSKPDPEVFLKAADSLGVPVEECLVVEDANAGIQAAYAGGFQTVGVQEAAGNEHTTFPVKHFDEIIKLIEA